MPFAYPHRWPILGIVTTLALSASACTTWGVARWPAQASVATAARPHSPTAEAAHAATEPATVVRIADVPFFAQKRYQCGPAALAMALEWSGEKVDSEDLVASVYTPDLHGSLQASMIAAVRRHGRIGYVIDSPDELFAELRAGNPVIVLQNLRFSWWPAWHYAVVIGYDTRDRSVLMRSGSDAERSVGWRRFASSWPPGSRWGLVVLAPGKLPATATAHAYLKTVVALERVDQWDAAATSYRAALQRWPRNLAAAIGLANAELGLQRPVAAETILRATVQEHPHSAQAHNNFAHVLALNGKHDEALRQARMAVLLGGKHTEIYRQTLEQIEGRTPP